MTLQEKKENFLSRIKFLNIWIDNVTMKEAVEKIDCMVINGSNQYVVTPNVDHIVKLEHDKLFQEVYRHADLILADGQILLWISRLLKNPIIEKVSGADLFPKVCERAAQRGYSIFLLGAAEGIAKTAAEKLSLEYSGIKIVGTYSPPVGFENNRLEKEKIFQMINDAKPHILAIGLGTPKQEKFFYTNREYICVPVVLNIGATFDFIAGKVRRAPKWISNMGLEWLYRLFKEPRRLAKRYLVDDLKIWKIYLKYRKIK